jgi:hypothetical protein
MVILLTAFVLLSDAASALWVRRCQRSQQLTDRVSDDTIDPQI